MIGTNEGDRVMGGWGDGLAAIGYRLSAYARSCVRGVWPSGRLVLPITSHAGWRHHGGMKSDAVAGRLAPRGASVGDRGGIGAKHPPITLVRTASRHHRLSRPVGQHA